MASTAAVDRLIGEMTVFGLRVKSRSHKEERLLPGPLFPGFSIRLGSANLSR
jgi:hypothetical protein